MKGRLGFSLGLLSLAGVSFWLRSRELGSQILGGDELHFLQVVCENSFREILGLVTDTDFSIPLALLVRLVTDWFPLSEISLRFPFLVLGSVFPVLVVLFARRSFPLSCAWIAGFLIAAHPFFVFYSRFVRPYGLCLVLLFSAFWLHDLYFRTGKRRFLLVSTGLGAVASWIQLVALVTLAALFAGSLLRAPLETRRGTVPPRSWIWVVGAGLGALILTVVLYVPAIGGIREQILGDNLGQGGMNAEILWRNGQVLAGWPSRWGPIVLGVAAGLGALLCLRSSPVLGLWLLVPLIGQGLAIFVLKPRLVHFSFVLSRYVFYVLPVLFLLVSVGLDGLVRGVARGVAGRKPDGGKGPEKRGAVKLWDSGPAAFGCGALLFSVWAVGGPVFDIYRSGRGFAHHNVFQTYEFLGDPRWVEGGKRRDFSDLPSVYGTYAEAPMILESPPPESFYDNPYVFFQHLHGRPIRLLASGESFWSSDRFRFRNVVTLSSPEPFAEVPKGTVIFLHLDIAKEIPRYLRRRPSHRVSEVYGAEAVHRLRLELRQRCGPPSDRAGGIEVYRVP